MKKKINKNDALNAWAAAQNNISEQDKETMQKYMNDIPDVLEMLNMDEKQINIIKALKIFNKDDAPEFLYSTVCEGVGLNVQDKFSNKAAYYSYILNNVLGRAGQWCTFNQLVMASEFLNHAFDEHYQDNNSELQGTDKFFDVLHRTVSYVEDLKKNEIVPSTLLESGEMIFKDFQDSGVFTDDSLQQWFQSSNVDMESVRKKQELQEAKQKICAGFAAMGVPEEIANTMVDKITNMKKNNMYNNKIIEAIEEEYQEYMNRHDMYEKDKKLDLAKKFATIPELDGDKTSAIFAVEYLDMVFSCDSTNIEQKQEEFLEKLHTIKIEECLNIIINYRHAILDKMHHEPTSKKDEQYNTEIQNIANDYTNLKKYKQMLQERWELLCADVKNMYKNNILKYIQYYVSDITKEMVYEYDKNAEKERMRNYANQVQPINFDNNVQPIQEDSTKNIDIDKEFQRIKGKLKGVEELLSKHNVAEGYEEFYNQRLNQNIDSDDLLYNAIQERAFQLTKSLPIEDQLKVSYAQMMQYALIEYGAFDEEARDSIKEEVVNLDKTQDKNLKHSALTMTFLTYSNAEREGILKNLQKTVQVEKIQSAQLDLEKQHLNELVDKLRDIDRSIINQYSAVEVQLEKLTREKECLKELPNTVVAQQKCIDSLAKEANFLHALLTTDVILAQEKVIDVQREQLEEHKKHLTALTNINEIEEQQRVVDDLSQQLKKEERSLIELTSTNEITQQQKVVDVLLDELKHAKVSFVSLAIDGGIALDIDQKYKGSGRDTIIDTDEKYKITDVRLDQLIKEVDRVNALAQSIKQQDSQQVMGGQISLDKVEKRLGNLISEKQKDLDEAILLLEKEKKRVHDLARESGVDIEDIAKMRQAIDVQTRKVDANIAAIDVLHRAYKQDHYPEKELFDILVREEIKMAAINDAKSQQQKEIDLLMGGKIVTKRLNEINNNSNTVAAPKTSQHTNSKGTAVKDMVSEINRSTQSQKGKIERTNSSNLQQPNLKTAEAKNSQNIDNNQDNVQSKINKFNNMSKIPPKIDQGGGLRPK